MVEALSSFFTTEVPARQSRNQTVGLKVEGRALSVESSSVGSRPVFCRGLRSHRVRLHAVRCGSPPSQRSQRGEPAAQRPSSSTSSPLPPLSPVQIPLVGRGVLTAPNTFTSTGGGVGTHRPTKWNRSKQSKQRCPIPLCVPLRPLWLKKEERASTTQTAGFAAKVPLWQCRENVVGRRRFLLIVVQRSQRKRRNPTGGNSARRSSKLFSPTSPNRRVQAKGSGGQGPIAT